MLKYDLTKRIYPIIGDTVDELKKKYKQNIKIYEPNKSNVKDKVKEAIRIMSYNVHFWTDVDENENLDNICNTILELQPDIVCLQEVKATTIYTSKHKILDDYEILSFCNVTPSWFNDVYGNMILINKLFKLKIKNSANSEYYIQNICGKSNKCTLSQFNNTYKSFQCCNKHTPDKLMFEHGDETRCFIKISLPSFDIICTHLEAYNTEKRKIQLQELNEYITRETYILGDFNMINESIYPAKFKNDYIDNPVYERYKKIALGYDVITGFTDNIWENVSQTKPDFSLDITTWNGTAVDYIFRVIPKNQKEMIDEMTLIYNKLLGSRSKIIDIRNVDFGELLFTDNNLNNIDAFLSKYDLELIKLSKFFINMKSSDDYYMQLKKDVKKCIAFFSGSKTFNDARIKSTDLSFKNDYGMIVKKYEIDDYIEIIKYKFSIIFKHLTNKILKFVVYPSDSSDHLPLFIDINNNEITYTEPYTPGLEDIEKREEFSKNKFLELSVDDFIKFWNKINRTTFTDTDFTIYNGQPGFVHNWINFDSSISPMLDFKDPYNFGTSKGSNSLGNIGIYGADTYEHALSWGKSFSDNYITNNPTASVDEKSLVNTNIVFEIKLNLRIPGIKIIYIDNELEWMNYNDKFDQEYDIIVGEQFKELKITKKNYDETSSRKNKYMTLGKKYSINNTNAELIKIYNFKQITPQQYELSEKLPPTIPVVPGGSGDIYKLKYLKYKQKYLDLKKNMV